MHVSVVSLGTSRRFTRRSHTVVSFFVSAQRITERRSRYLLTMYFGGLGANTSGLVSHGEELDELITCRLPTAAAREGTSWSHAACPSLCRFNGSRTVLRFLPMRSIRSFAKGVERKHKTHQSTPTNDAKTHMFTLFAQPRNGIKKTDRLPPAYDAERRRRLRPRLTPTGHGG